MWKELVEQNKLQSGSKRFNTRTSKMTLNNKKEIKQELQYIEAQLILELKNVIKGLLENYTSPESVVEAFEQAERDKEREKYKEKIIGKLAQVYMIEKENKIVVKNIYGHDKLTNAGDYIYKLFSETVIDIAKLHGSSSHMKIVSHRTYKAFEKTLGITTELRKESVIMSNGQNRESVYVDLIKRGLLGKFAKFIEDNYVLNV